MAENNIYFSHFIIFGVNLSEQLFQLSLLVSVAFKFRLDKYKRVLKQQLNYHKHLSSIVHVAVKISFTSGLNVSTDINIYCKIS